MADGDLAPVACLGSRHARAIERGLSEREQHELVLVITQRLSTRSAPS
jgi:hypothetical protein